MPNWDDQFDFEDLDEPKPKTQKPAKGKDKKVNPYEDDFLDDVDRPGKKQTKSVLPTINPRSSANSNKKLQQFSAKINPFADKSFGSKQMAYDEYNNQFEEQLEENQATPAKLGGKIRQDQAKKIGSEKANTVLNSKIQSKQSIKQPQEQNYEQEQFEQSIKPAQKQNVISQSKSKSVKQTDHFYGQASTKSKENLGGGHKNITKQKASQDQYEEQFQQDQYTDQYFDEQPASPIKNITNNQNQLTQKQTKSHHSKKYLNNEYSTANINTVNNADKKKIKLLEEKNLPVKPPKPPIKEKPSPKQPLSINKNIRQIGSQSLSKPLNKSSSKQSIRSNGQAGIKGSRISQRNQSQFFGKKHTDLVEKTFPHDEEKLNSLTQLQINKINQKMRGMIRKFNEELNDLINKNMLLLKNKSLDKQLSLNQKIRQLEIQKKSGQTAIEVMEKDFEKLQGRQGQLRQEQYQLILERQIEDKKMQIKEASKQITNLKRQVDSRGKKLSAKQVEKQNAQNIHHLKTILIQTRKDQQKGDERIQKLVSTYEQLETKISDIDYKLDELISEAKQKGINTQNTESLTKKFQELKNKVQNMKGFNKKTQNLSSTKIQILNHQNDQIKLTIKNINSQISNFYSSIDHSQNEAIKLIQKAKQKPSISPLFAENLDKLLKQLSEARNNNDYLDARSEVKSRRSDSTKIHLSKNNIQETGQKSLPLRATQSQNKPIENQEIDPSRQKFLKMKPVEQAKLQVQSKSKPNQRIWTNQEATGAKPNPNDQNIQLVDEKIIVSGAIETKEDQKKDKIKPFMLKKSKAQESRPEEINQSTKAENSPGGNSTKISENNHNLQNPATNEPTKKEQSLNINLAPRMMRFNKKTNNEELSRQVKVNENEGLKKGVELAIQKQGQSGPSITSNKGEGLSQNPIIQNNQASNLQTEVQKPIFVPRRFNMRNKVQKKDDSYTPSIQKQVVTETQGQVMPKDKTQQPSQSHKQQFQPQNQNQIRQQTQKPSEAPQIKPRFNLRLRDRMNKNVQIQSNNPNKQIDNYNVASNEPKFNIAKKPQQNQTKTQNVFKVEKNLNQGIQETAPIKAINYYAANHLKKASQNLELNQVSQNSNQVQKSIPNQNITNPYAPKLEGAQNQYIRNLAPKKQRQPLKKNKKINDLPKQSFNIYSQAIDMTSEVKEIGSSINNTKHQKATRQPLIFNTIKEQPNINEMLGINKKTKKNDFDDLLGDAGNINMKNKKKNNDFFSDLQF